MRVVKLFMGMAAAVYLVLMAVLFATQRKLLYYPTHSYVPLHEFDANRAFQEITVRTRDGINLRAWYAPATSKPFTIVFFHGNADSLHSAAQIADPYIAAGYGFLLTEYRGYSGLPGRPTEAGLYADGRAYLRWLMSRGVGDEQVFLLGHSLGAGVAVEMAEEFHVRGVMLLAPYLSIAKLAQVYFPFFPSQYLVRDRFENEKKIAHVHCPLLIVNGDNDHVTPPAQGRQLYALAQQPKEFHSLPNRGHNDAFDEFAPLSMDWMRRVNTKK